MLYGLLQDGTVTQVITTAGGAHAGDRGAARAELAAAADADPSLAAPRAALGALDAGAAIRLQFTPELVRPWGDAEAVGQALDQ